jgi:phenylacetic acid degradation operon negative regulatory protein
MKKTDDIERAIDRLLGERPPRAGSLVVSVFGDAVVPHGGAIWLGTLIRWLGRFGVNERAVRTAVQRLAADEWFRSETVGRMSRYSLTRASRHRFADAERRIYAATPPAWDGAWSIVVLGPMRVALRDSARRELRWHGFGELSPSVLLHPSADLDELALALRDLRLDGKAVVLRAGAEERLEGARRPLRELVASAWDLRDLEREYGSFVRRFRPIVDRLSAGSSATPDACFRLRILAVHEYRRILLRDPELPAELLPDGWAGAEARRVCAALYRRVEGTAAAYVVESGRMAGGVPPKPAEFYFRRFGGLRASRSTTERGAT